MVDLAGDWILLERGGQRILQCRPLLALSWLRHGFSLRTDTAGKIQNMALHAGDDRQDAPARRGAFLAALGLEPDALVAAQQVHGTRVAVVGPAARGAGAADYAAALPETDGLATTEPGLPLSVYYADCAPLLLAEPGVRAVAAVHAGWRGAVSGIAARAVETMAVSFGADPARILAAVGPCIGPCCYRVGPEVIAAVPEKARGLVVREAVDSLYLDLPGLNAWYLLAAGVPASGIFRSGECTGCHPDLYHSHRRHGPGAGRMMAAIARVN
ncbi:MAG: peptidoglycan editing factor PgeF [Bacteroidota bacterium]